MRHFPLQSCRAGSSLSPWRTFSKGKKTELKRRCPEAATPRASVSLPNDFHIIVFNSSPPTPVLSRGDYHLVLGVPYFQSVLMMVMAH